MQDPFISGLEDLSQRVYDIQACISCALNGSFDLQAINSLNIKMSQIENSIRDIEEDVARLPDINELNAVIDEMRDVYEACHRYQPDIDEYEQTPLSVQNTNTNTSRAAQVPHAAPNLSSIATNSSKKTKVKNQKAPQNLPTPTQIPPQPAKPQAIDDNNEIIKQVTEQELDQAMKSINYRIPFDKMNACISEINDILAKKQAIIKIQPNRVKASVRKQWERYKDEELKDDERLFFTNEDIKDTVTLKNNSNKVLVVLQALNRVSCSIDGKVKRYFVK